MIRKLALGAALTLALSSAALAGHWARFRGPNGTGVADQQNLPVKLDTNGGILWKVAIPGTGNASPIVWDQRLFIHGATPKERYLLCLDTANGRTLWKKSIAGGPVKFRIESSLASSTPVTDGAMVYVPFWDGKDVQMVAYDFAGNRKWAKNLGPFISQHGSGASPILYKDMLIFANDMDKEDKNKNLVERPSVLVAFNKATGDIVWETPREANRACYSAPMILERKGQPDELIVTSTTAVTSYHPGDGKPNWEWHWTFAKMALRTITSTVHVDGMLFVTSGDGGGDRHMAAIDLKGAGKGAQPGTAWENKKDFPYVPSMLSRGPHLYFVNDRGFAGCYEARSGKKVWLERLEGATFNSSPVLVDGKMYAASVEGDLFVIAAEPDYQLVGKSSLGEVVRASLSVADQRLYVRGEQHLFSIGKK